MTNNTFIQFHRHGFYFRIFGYGIEFNTRSAIFFSERAGIDKPLLRIGQFSIKWLKSA